MWACRLVLRRATRLAVPRSDFHHSAPHLNSGPRPKLTTLDVSARLRQHEYTLAPPGPQPGDPISEGADETLAGPVKAYDINTLHSNDPNEDSHAEARLSTGDGTGSLFGIFDGHGGASCGQVAAKRMFGYIAASLLSPEDLGQHLEARQAGKETDELYHVLEPFHEVSEFVSDIQGLYELSYVRFLESLAEEAKRDLDAFENRPMEVRLKRAFLALDNHMAEEAIRGPEMSPEEAGTRLKTLSVALSGAVATVAHIQGPELHVANCGDVTAVLGSLSENETWVAKKLTVEHNADNQDEVERIVSEHPGESVRDIMKGDRLLGILAPVRALGDFKFKWSLSTIRETLAGVSEGHLQSLPKHYLTPPYLTCVPDVIHHRLSPKDKFLVIGSDGLWDMMTPMQVIRLVGEHMSGKVTLSPLHINQPQIALGQLRDVLVQRQAAMKLKPLDSNAATHLIRNALGGSAYGVDHDRLVQMLTMPEDMVRMFRDDITVTVIFFDQEYLRHC